MSIASRARNPKRPTTSSRTYRQPQPYRHPIAKRLFGLFRPEPKSGGGFGGCTKAERFRKANAA